ncbi:MAG TPA: BamA/TamA family outer membrane protein [Polyangiaceae bacterium]|nr:BamA/TamA family outer membrane protein [Polyangiaceae bacterium]
MPRRFLPRLAAAFVALAFLLRAPSASAAADPRLLWKSIETPHYRINYYSTEDEVAEHIATLAESIYARLLPAIGWAPSERIEVVLTDQTEAANGSATALPYDAITLYVTAPDDMSPLGDVDDWYLELLTHESTHIFHTDRIAGLPALVNRILGKTLAPNQAQPRWLLEGLAIFEESARTSGGRLRSSMWNMWMRADVLEGHVAPLDVFSNTPRYWPQGNIWYLYGSFFMQWIAETYGEQAIRAMIDDYGHQLIPYGINRSIRRVTGRTFEQLYPAWVDSMRRTFVAEADAIRERGLREGIRLSHTGNTVEHPRWIPATTWKDHGGDLAFYVDDGHSMAGYWGLPLVRDEHGTIVGARERERDLLIRMNGIGGLSFMPNGTAVFATGDWHENLYVFNDLFELPADQKSPNGMEGRRIRWTDAWRALDPDVSPDGRRVVFTTNHRGTMYLMIADLAASPDQAGAHTVTNVRPLVRSARFDLAYTPRWAPDGMHVAYSSWERGGYRDIRIVDTRDGSYVEVTHDRAIDGDPVFSPDGRWLYFHSDRTGVTNVYAYEVATGRLKQVTNVINGAYQPEPSPDGKWLAYVGYTHDGYDLFVMPLDESQWLDALPYVEERPAAPPEPLPLSFVAHPYNPLLTLQPHNYSVRITPGNFGEASIVTTSGGDIAGLHAFTASLTTEWNHPTLEGNISYTYSRLPFDVNVSAYRQITPQTNYYLGGNPVQWIQQTLGASTGIAYSLPRAFDSQSFALSYSVNQVSGQLPLPASLLNPYNTPSVPTRGMLTTLHLGWSYSNATGFLWSVSNEQGFDVSANLDLSDPAIGSDFSGYAAQLNFATYFAMPWLQHHVLALHAGGGFSGGNMGGDGPFYVGGFIDLPLVNVIENSLVQGGIQLRGYPVAYEIGQDYALFNAEYRFPILSVDRGLSTLPIFLDRINGNLFVDYGSAFNDASSAEFKTGVGGELWFDVQLGYILDFTFRAGFAKGLASGGIDKLYFVAAVPF